MAGFLFNVSLLTLNYDLPLNVLGYEHRMITNILMNPIPGSFVDMGTLTLRPLDLNTNNIAGSWEDFYFGPGLNVNPTADADGDGSSNWEEYIAGTHPLISTSVCALKSISSSNGNVRMTWDTAPGCIYRIGCPENLPLQADPPVAETSNDWSHSMGPWTSAVNTTEMEWTDTNGIPFNQNYRLEVEVQQ
ncbi:MAG: hypothetical protein GKR87_09720 [Kiritimatiellae bacterium]|nr:hypothetical protein [Kiritimatiellia bacterium]